MEDKRVSVGENPYVWLYLSVSAVFWCASLFLPAIIVTGETQPSFYLLLAGWLGLLNLQFGWLANPLFLVSWASLALRRPRIAFALSTLGLTFAGSVLANPRFPSGDGSDTTNIEGFLVGYWVWMLGIIILAAGSIHSMVRSGGLRA